MIDPVNCPTCDGPPAMLGSRSTRGRYYKVRCRYCPDPGPQGVSLRSLDDAVDCWNGSVDEWLSENDVGEWCDSEVQP